LISKKSTHTGTNAEQQNRYPQQVVSVEARLYLVSCELFIYEHFTKQYLST
jgi:hypothetical protein